MSKVDELQKEYDELLARHREVSQDYNDRCAEMRSIDRKLKAAKKKEQFKEYKYKIVNDRVEEVTDEDWNNERKRVIFKHGMAYQEDDYGMGACHWPLLRNKYEARQRQLIENVIWAVGRLPESKFVEEVEQREILNIILTGGQSRDDWWKKLPGVDND